jgi:hypothetical protein
VPQITYCVVQPFERTEKGAYRVLQAVQASNRGDAIRRAQRCAEKGGAVAFARTGDLDTGEFSDAEILGTYGEVPPDFMAAA